MGVNIRIIYELNTTFAAGICVTSRSKPAGERHSAKPLFTNQKQDEKTFLIHSPLVEKVEVVRVGKARRAKLYYLRERTGKASKTKEMVGARIENREITIKEDLAEAPAEVVEEVAEAPVAEETTENKAE